MITTAIILLAGSFLWWKGWLTFEQTGILKPLINVTLFGVSIQIKKPML